MHFSSLCRETGRASLKLDALKQCEFLLFSNCLHLSWHLVCVSVAQLCLTLCESMACSLPASSVHGDSPGKNTGGGSQALLQGVFPTQGSNQGLPCCCRWILYSLSHQEGPYICKIQEITFKFYIVIQLLNIQTDEWGSGGAS